MSPLAWAAELARAVYGLGLLLLGAAFVVLIARFGRPALAVLADLSGAIRFAAEALRAATASQETVARVESKVDRILDAVTRKA